MAAAEGAHEGPTLHFHHHLLPAAVKSCHTAPGGPPTTSSNPYSNSLAGRRHRLRPDRLSSSAATDRSAPWASTARAGIAARAKERMRRGVFFVGGVGWGGEWCPCDLVTMGTRRRFYYHCNTEGDLYRTHASFNKLSPGEPRT